MSGELACDAGGEQLRYGERDRDERRQQRHELDGRLTALTGRALHPAHRWLAIAAVAVTLPSVPPDDRRHVDADGDRVGACCVID